MFGVRRSVGVAVVALVAVLAGTATAYAYWTTSGSGTGTATVVSEIKPLVITQVAVTGLVPGGEARNLKVTVSNANDFSINIAQRVLKVTPTVNKPLCDFTKNFTLTSPADHPSTVPANGEVSFSGGSIKLLDVSTVDQGVCLGAVVTFTYRLAVT